jgi:hypothetical protein
MEEKQTFRKIRRAKSPTDFETWGGCQVANTLNTFDQGDVRTSVIVAEAIGFDGYNQQVTGGGWHGH